jgi:hypothetical protein
LGYFLIELIGDWTADGRVSAGLNSGTILTTTERGSYFGGVLSGLRDGTSQTWIGQGLLSSQGEPLAYSGVWGDLAKSTLYYNDGTGRMAVGGHEVGRIGNTAPFWTGGTALTAMGTYTDTPGVSSYLLNSAISGSGTQDGVSASFQGYASGIWTGGRLEGDLLGFYTTSDGKAGWLSEISGRPSTFGGDYYDGLKMWRASAGFAAVELPLEGKTGLAIVSGAPWYHDVKLSGHYLDAEGLKQVRLRSGEHDGPAVPDERSGRSSLPDRADDADGSQRVFRASGDGHLQRVMEGGSGRCVSGCGAEWLPLGYFLGSVSGSWITYDSAVSGYVNGTYLTATEIGSLGGSLAGFGG